MKNACIPLHLILYVISTAAAQPHGWPCDYGFRPGNAWFYTSIGDPTVWSVWALRDSMGVDGAYWIYVETPRFMSGHWYRIDSSCTFDSYLDPSINRFRRVFKAAADTGDPWLVETSEHGAPEYALVSALSYSNGHSVKEVLSYLVDDRGNMHVPNMVEWTESVGITRMQAHVSDHYELVGRTNDGMHYGHTSGINYQRINGALHADIHPIPATSSVLLTITGGNGTNGSIAIHDLFGRLIQRQPIERPTDDVFTTPLYVSALQPGAYVASVEIAGTRYATPLIVVR